MSGHSFEDVGSMNPINVQPCDPGSVNEAELLIEFSILAFLQLGITLEIDECERYRGWDLFIIWYMFLVKVRYPSTGRKESEHGIVSFVLVDEQKPVNWRCRG